MVGRGWGLGDSVRSALYIPGLVNVNPPSPGDIKVVRGGEGEKRDT